jgi:hypothetical protein
MPFLAPPGVADLRSTGRCRSSLHQGLPLLQLHLRVRPVRPYGRPSFYPYAGSASPPSCNYGQAAVRRTCKGRPLLRRLLPFHVVVRARPGARVQGRVSALVPLALSVLGKLLQLILRCGSRLINSYRQLFLLFLTLFSSVSWVFLRLCGLCIV